MPTSIKGLSMKNDIDSVSEFISEIDICISEEMVDRVMEQGRLLSMQIVIDVPPSLISDLLLPDILNNSQFSDVVNFKLIRFEDNKQSILITYRDESII